MTTTTTTETTTGRKRMSKDERKAQILAVGRDLFGREGYRNVRTKDLASQCGVTEPVIYQHFTNKCDLAKAVIVKAFKDQDLETIVAMSIDARTNPELNEAFGKINPKHFGCKGIKDLREKIGKMILDGLKTEDLAID